MENQKLQEILELAINNKASDLHLIVGLPITIRVHGELYPLFGGKIFEQKEMESLIFEILGPTRKDIFIKNRELDFSYELIGKMRFRVNTYFARGNPACSLRLLPLTVPSIESLNLPSICHKFVGWRQGFVLITGPTGHGKSTTVAAILEEINQTRPCHLVSVEDPIEYLLKPKKAIVSQREIGSDTLSWQAALRSCLREDPNVVFIGEMRDLETIAAALTIAETGHLVFSTLHTNSAAQTIDRIIDVFPEESKTQVRIQLASVLGAVISQRLVPAAQVGRVPAMEVLLANAAVKTAIRESKTHMIDNIIQTSGEMGMMSLEKSLSLLVTQGAITREAALEFALRPDDFLRQIR